MGMAVAVIVGMVMVVMIIVAMRMTVFMRKVLMSDLPFADERIDFADNGAQHIRLVRQISRSGAIADCVHDHRREAFRELVHNTGNNACACWRRQFEAVVR